MLGPFRRARALSPAALGRFQIVALLPRVDARLAAVVALLVVASGGLPLAFTLLSGILIGSLPEVVVRGLDSPAGETALRAFGLLAIVFVLQRLVGPLRGITASHLGQQLEQQLEERVMRAVCAPTGIAHLEDAAMLDRISNAQEVGTTGWWKPAGAVTALAAIAPLWLQSVGFAVLVGSFQWWLGAGVLAVQIVASGMHRREYLRTVKVQASGTNSLRRAHYLRDLALTPAPAKEVRLFGLAEWLIARFSGEWTRTMAPIWADRDRGASAHAWAAVLSMGSYGAALAYVGWAGIQGTISLTTLAVLVGAIGGVRAIGRLDVDDMRLAWGTAAVPAVLELERLLANGRGGARMAPVADGRGTAAADTSPAAGGIRFDGVTFRYPGSAADALSELTLDIPAGRSLAIVGANGAGKTTLIKLLCRLYEPQAGRITVGGTPVSDLAPEVWRQRLAAIFQDFVRYELPVRDNVGFGAPAQAGDLDRLRDAARRAGALDVIEKLPAQWDTVLSRQFSGGADLSGGEWQRVALARALFAVNGGADVLILDEPTASLDVRAEAALYERFLDITRGLTTILVSHRFSTVRRAHRICVLEDGRIAEQGTHAALMARGGRYAEMFSLQAARFADEQPKRGRPRGAG